MGKRTIIEDLPENILPHREMAPIPYMNAEKDEENKKLKKEIKDLTAKISQKDEMLYNIQNSKMPESIQQLWDILKPHILMCYSSNNRKGYIGMFNVFSKWVDTLKNETLKN